MDWTLLIDVVVVLGVSIVCPLALGHARWWWAAAAAATVAALLPIGWGAAALATIWVLLAAVVLARTLAQVLAAGVRVSSLVDGAVRVGAPGFALVAALAFIASCGGLAPFGTEEPILELTAVHFTYAGVGALTLAGAVTTRRAAGRTIAVLFTIAAPPLVATGFLTHHPLPQVGGAVLMSAGVLLVAALQLREALTGGVGRRALLVVSGAAPWLPMGLAVAWAASLYWTVPALSIPDMARTHGVLNVVFVVAGLLARRSRPDASAPVPPTAPPLGLAVTG
ncbi:MAG: YndJ family transporter [Microthrixaceae bacterium]